MRQDLDFIEEPFREEGTHRPVDQAGCQNLFQAGTAFPFKEAAGEFTGSGHPFTVITREGKEIRAGFAWRRGNGTKKNSVITPDEAAAVSLLR